MARIRSLHPGQWTDEDFVQCSPLARLLALGLRSEADDQGIFEWKPVTHKMRLLPADNADMEALLSELVAHRQVKKFDHEGKSYGVIRNFTRYQRPKKPNSVYFMPPEFRTYASSGGDSSELDGDEASLVPNSQPVEPPQVPPKAEITKFQVPPVPQKSEIAPQMKEEGGRRLDEGGRREGVQGEGVSPPDGGSSAPAGASKPKPAKRKTRLEDEFVIEINDQRYAYATECGMTEAILEIECDKFENHHKSKGNHMADWDAAWRTWVRNWQSFSQQRARA